MCGWKGGERLSKHEPQSTFVTDESRCCDEEMFSACAQQHHHDFLSFPKTEYDRKIQNYRGTESHVIYLLREDVENGS